MKNGEWRYRLAEALASSGKSKRAVSLESGNGPGYMHSILSEGKEPTVQNLIDVCNAIGVSPVYILHGFEASPDEAELLRLIQNNPSKRDAIISLLAS